MEVFDEYLSHISDDGRKELLIDHLKETSRLAAGFASAFGAEEDGRAAGLLHDIGKYSDFFQKRIRGAAIKVDHSTAGALECLKLGYFSASYAVASHHTGLPDGNGGRDIKGRESFSARIVRAKEGLIEDYSAWKSEIISPEKRSIPEEADDAFCKMLYVRMLFSSLVDADWLATENFMKGPRPKSFQDIEELGKRFHSYMERFSDPSNPLDAERSRLMRISEKAGRLPGKGLYRMTVPTGGGKTLASMAFALERARKAGKKRIIYVLPYRTVIEQTAGIFRKIFGAGNVLEHHSSADWGEGHDAMELLLASENWDAPIIVTTSVQFYESFFSSGRRRCRKLHNVAGSIVILDEAQCLPREFLIPCTDLIAALVKDYRTDVVLSTATQPALKELLSMTGRSTEVFEIAEGISYDSDIWKRVSVRRYEYGRMDDLASEVAKDGQALVIVNRKKDARMLWSLLPPEGRYCLTTWMTPRHRRQVIAEIRKRLDEGKICRVASTSLIEAGIDIDFPSVWREETGLDRIVQAAGRCNREGRRSKEESYVTVFRNAERYESGMSIDIQALHETERIHGDIFSEDALDFYFRRVTALSRSELLDGKGIMDLIEGRAFPFAETEKRFRLIDDAAKQIVVPLMEGRTIAERLLNGECSKELMREMQSHASTVSEREYRELIANGSAVLTEYGIAVLSDETLYGETGLDTEGGIGWV